MESIWKAAPQTYGHGYCWCGYMCNKNHNRHAGARVTGDRTTSSNTMAEALWHVINMKLLNNTLLGHYTAAIYNTDTACSHMMVAKQLGAADCLKPSDALLHT